MDILTFFKNLFSGNFKFTSDYNNTHQYASTHDAEGNYTGTSMFSLENIFGKDNPLGNLKGLVDALIAHYTRNELTGAEREQNEWNAAEAEKSRQFTEYMQRNKYSMETGSMQDAGLNPAMVYGGGNLVSTAANGATGQGNVSAGGDIFAALATMMRLPQEIKEMKTGIELKEQEREKAKAEAEKARAEAHKTEVEAEGATNYNTWFIDTYELRKQGLELANKLTGTQERAIYKQLDVMEQSIKESKSREAANYAQEILNKANAFKIAAMLPYEQALTAAQTEQAKAQAKLAAVNAAYQQGLIDNGYLDALCDKAKAEAGSAAAREQMDQIRAAIRNGTFGQMEYNGNVFHDALAGLTNAGNDVLQGLVLFMENLNPLTGLLGQ